jgi:fructoselysine-6-P-deglycase FrlB-like protein
MLTIEREIATQPEVWRRSTELAEAQRGVLLAASDRIALIGRGTSYFAAQATALARGRDPNFPRHLTRSVVLN